MDGWIPNSMRRPDTAEGSVGSILREKNRIARNLHRRVLSRDQELEHALKDNSRLEEELEETLSKVQTLKGLGKTRMSACLKFTANLRSRMFQGLDPNDTKILEELEALEKMFFENIDEISPISLNAIEKYRDSSEIKDNDGKENKPGYTCMSNTPKVLMLSSNESKRKSPSLIISENQILSLKKQLNTINEQYQHSEISLQKSTEECTQLKRLLDETSALTKAAADMHERQLVSLEESIENKEKKINVYETKVDELGKEFRKEQTNSMTLKKQVLLLEGEKKALMEELRETKEKLDEEAVLRNESIRQCEETQNQLQLALCEAGREVETREELQLQLTKKNEELCMVTGQNQTQINDLNVQLRDTKAALSQLQKESVSWTQKRGTLTKANQDLAMSLKDVKKICEDKQQTIEKLENELMKSEVRFEDKFKEYTALLSTTDNLKQSLHEVTSEKSALRDHYEDRLSKTIDNNEASKEKQRKQVDLLRNQLRGAEASMHEMQNTHSVDISSLKNALDDENAICERLRTSLEEERILANTIKTSNMELKEELHIAQEENITRGIEIK